MPRPRPATVLKIAVPAILFFLILRSADLGRVAGGMARIPPPVYASGFLLLFSGIALQALRWRILLRDPGIPYRECYIFIAMGSALAMVSPSSLLADIAFFTPLITLPGMAPISIGGMGVRSFAPFISYRTPKSREAVSPGWHRPRPWPSPILLPRLSPSPISPGRHDPSRSSTPGGSRRRP